MPTATKTSKPRATAARKAPSRKTATARKATYAKASRTRAANETQTAIRDSQRAARESAGVVGDYAERAVLIPVGADGEPLGPLPALGAAPATIEVVPGALPVIC